MAALQADFAASLAIQKVGKTANIAAGSYSASDEAHDEGDQLFFEVADGVSNQAVAMGGLTTIEGILFQATDTVTVKLNGDSTGFACKGFQAWGANITAMTISNASGSQVECEIVRVGT